MTLIDQTVPTQEAFGQPLAALGADDLIKAEKLLRQILENLPEDEATLYELGLVLNARGDHRSALDVLRALVQRSPCEPTFQAALGEVLAALGRYDEAVPAFRRSVALSSAQVQAAPSAPPPFSVTRLRDAMVATANELLAGFGRQEQPLRFHDLVQMPRVWKYQMLSDCDRVTGAPVASQPVLLKGRGEIRFGADVQFGWHASPQFYSGYSYVEAGLADSVIEIGDRALFNNSAVVRSEGPGIRIGADALFGTDVQIYDSDFHDLHPGRRRSGVPATAHVDIGDNVFAGSNVTILRGVTIGANTIVGSGSTVTADLPADVIAAGSPAKVLRDL